MPKNASPQLEDGYTRIANELLEAMSLYPFTGGEARTVLTIIRNTYGYRGRKIAGISLGNLAVKTNLSRRHIVNIVNNLRKSSVITVIRVGDRNIIGINKSYTSWRLWISDMSRNYSSLGVVKPSSPE